MPKIRIHLDCDRPTARRALQLHRADKIHHESRNAARAEAERRGWTPSAEPVFVGVTNGQPPQLVYEADVYPETTR